MGIETACQIMEGEWVNSRTVRRPFRGVSVDTRSLRPGNAFFCLRGTRTDGHQFAVAAQRRGAALIVAERGWAGKRTRWHVPVIGVDDPLTALGDLAAEFRRHFPTRYIAITGSVGKTTTKEMIAAALAERFRVFKSPGNYNSLIGIPLALLGRSDTPGRAARYGVLEFGMSTPGEIARLTQIVQPEWGVVTRIAPSHLMQMKSLPAIARAKRELFDYADPRTIAFLNDDDPYQRRWHHQWARPTVTYALQRRADFTADDVRTLPDGNVAFRVNGRHAFTLPLFGAFNVANALAAVAVGRRLGVSFGDLARALSHVEPAGHRSRIAKLGAITLIEDCYNANPASTTAALTDLSRWNPAGRRIAVLGTMRELGASEAAWHRRVGKVAGRTTDWLIAVGDLAKEYIRGATSSSRVETKICRDREAAVRILDRVVQPGDIILLKASHSEQFEDIAAHLRRCWQKAKGKGRVRTGPRR
jgi:UDP-N-acetylmuramoyl-tripeptide--D-alanyl-D-alanine ligase